MIQNQRQENIDKIADLILMAEPHMIDYTYSHSGKTARDFLKKAYYEGEGFFSHKYLYVMTENNEIQGIFTLYPAKLYNKLLLNTLKETWCYFNLRGFFYNLIRSLSLMSMYKKPNTNYMYLANIAIAPSYRGKGLFKNFDNFITAECCRHGCIGIELDVVNENELAQKIYLKYNYQVLSKSNYRGRLPFSGSTRMQKRV